MKIDTDFPFDDYDGYVVINPEKRKNVCLIHKKNKKRTTISFARYLLSVKERRFLTKYEEVDHVDGDKTNDNLDNLQIISKADNIRKSFLERGATKKMAEMSCPCCSKIFLREERNTHLKKGNHFSVCSKKCLYGMTKKGLSIDQMKEIGVNQIVRIFRQGQ